MAAGLRGADLAGAAFLVGTVAVLGLALAAVLAFVAGLADMLERVAPRMGRPFMGDRREAPPG
ncbi:MAG: hypothetical protein NTW56_10435 [Alphaproteobacteria bacterium]|nr:hypothetical protein [Alphaproteobacteria bacterium]